MLGRLLGRLLTHATDVGLDKKNSAHSLCPCYAAFLLLIYLHRCFKRHDYVTFGNVNNMDVSKGRV